MHGSLCSGGHTLSCAAGTLASPRRWPHAFGAVPPSAPTGAHATHAMAPTVRQYCHGPSFCDTDGQTAIALPAAAQWQRLQQQSSHLAALPFASACRHATPYTGLAWSVPASRGRCCGCSRLPACRRGQNILCSAARGCSPRGRAPAVFAGWPTMPQGRTVPTGSRHRQYSTMPWYDKPPQPGKHLRKKQTTAATLRPVQQALCRRQTQYIRQTTVLPTASRHLTPTPTSALTLLRANLPQRNHNRSATL